MDQLNNTKPHFHCVPNKLYHNITTTYMYVLLGLDVYINHLTVGKNPKVLLTFPVTVIGLITCCCSGQTRDTVEIEPITISNLYICELMYSDLTQCSK